MTFTILNVIPVSSKLFKINSDNKENIGSCIQLGGIFCDTKYFWLVRGSCLIVGCTKTGLVIGNWKFNATSKAPVKINCVTELPRENMSIPFLIVGLKYNGEKGAICIFQFTSSKVVRAVELPNEVSRISIITTKGNECLLPKVLTVLDGVIVVGTSCGGLLLLDMCLQEVENATSMHRVLKDEKNACQTMDLQLDDISLLESHKNLANLNMEHLAIYLNGPENYSKQIFNLKGPDGTILGHLNNQNVRVTALYYCSQLCYLFVGYNFGVWQIWNLKEMNVVYTSPILDKNIPVTHFTVQEPCDDPRAFCYIWVIYNNVEPFSVGFPLAVMYALLFDTKIWHDKNGFFYQGLFSCHVRFQRELVLEVNNDGEPLGGCCMGLSSISKSVSNLNSTQEFSEDGLSYCFFTWNTWTIDRKLNTYLTVFDLNQWYKEQMPSYLHKRNEHVDSYTITVSISDFLNEDDSTLLDVKVDFKSLFQFKGAVKLEEHYYPSSLSFNLLTLKEKEVILMKHRGCQQNLLYQIITQGPVCLTNPSEFYHESIRVGLTPLFVEHEYYEISVDRQKEFLLNMALEQQLFCWLCKYAVISSFSFNSFMAWAWNRAQVLKQHVYELCNCLFDSISMSLDSNVCNTFSNCLKQLKLLKSLYEYLLKNSNFLPYLKTIREQLNNFETTIAYMDIIKWSINVGLLPETPSISNQTHDRLTRQFVPYPVNDINIFFKERRKLINDASNSDCNNSFFIDNLINSVKSLSTSQRKSIDDGAVKYPFPCLRSVLEIYLEDSLSLITKHQIFIYTLLDIMEYLDEDSYEMIKKKLRMFSIIFKIPTTVTKVVEAFWKLDHGNYYDAVNQLIDPHIRLEDIEIWYDKFLLQTLITHYQYKLALLFLQIKKPSLLHENDLCLVISLYIANDMLEEAYNFQKSRRVEHGHTKLIRHLFEECFKKNKIAGLLGLSLSVFEKKIFVEYLNEIQNPQLKNLKTLYLLQKYKYGHDMDNENESYFPPRRKEIVNAETSNKLCLPVVVYPQVFNGRGENAIKEFPVTQIGPILDGNTYHQNGTKNVSSENMYFTPHSILMKVNENNYNENLITGQKRLSFSPNPLKKNGNKLLNNMAQDSSEKCSINLDNFDDNTLSIQISPTKNQFELDVNASELKNATSEFEINEKHLMGNEKEVLETINTLTSSSKDIGRNFLNENYDNLQILNPLCVTEIEYVPKEEISNHSSLYLDKEINFTPKTRTVEKLDREIEIINENDIESYEIFEKVRNVNSLLENKENLEPSTCLGFSSLKSVNNDLNFSKNFVHVEDYTQFVEENKMYHYQNKMTNDKLLVHSNFENVRLDSFTKNKCTSTYQNKKQSSLWNSPSIEQDKKHTRTIKNNKNNRKVVSLIRIKVSPKRNHYEGQKNKNVTMEENDVTLITNKNTVCQKEHANTNYNKSLENCKNSLKQDFKKQSICESAVLLKTDYYNSSFKRNTERLSTRFRLTPKKGKEKRKTSAVSLIRLRITPVKEIIKSDTLESTGFNKQINVPFPQLLQSENEKLTQSAETKSNPNSTIFEKLINRNTNELIAEEFEEINLLNTLSRVEFIDKKYTELSSDVNDEYKQNFEKSQRKTNELTYCNDIQDGLTLTNKIQENHISTYEQENSKVLKKMQEFSSECLNGEVESKEETITKYKKTGNLNGSASFDKNGSVFVEINNGILSENFNSPKLYDVVDVQNDVSHTLIGTNNICTNNICDSYFKSVFQNETNDNSPLNYDYEHKHLRKQKTSFEKQNFQKNASEGSFLKETLLNSVSSGNFNILNKAVTDDDPDIGISISNDTNTANMTVKHNDDSEEISEDCKGAEHDLDTFRPSVHYMPNFDEIKNKEISDSKSAKKEKNLTAASINLTATDFFNDAFIKDDTNFTVIDNSENGEEKDCIKFVYAWVAEKGVNTSFPYETGEESSEEEYKLEKTDDIIEVSKKLQEESTINVDRYSQTVNTSKTCISLLPKGISTSKNVKDAHGAKIT